MRKHGDYLIIGEICIIGLAEAAHLACLFLNLSFSKGAMLFGMSAAALSVACVIFLTLHRRRRLCLHSLTKAGGRQTGGGKRTIDAPEAVLLSLFGVIAVFQLIFVGMGNTIYRQGDMTVETVGSFLETDAVYQVNPMTGMPYAQGIPLRLKILCLPSLYGSLCRLTGLEPVAVVQRMIPVLVLMSSYVAFSLLGRALFPEEGRKRACFLLMVSLLFWAGAYGYGMDGFNVLCCGWRGVTIRNVVLLPWLLSLCLRGRWHGAVLCVLAEACLVWTLYGCGACLAVTAGMALAEVCCQKSGRLKKQGAEKEGAK